MKRKIIAVVNSMNDTDKYLQYCLEFASHMVASLKIITAVPMTSSAVGANAVAGGAGISGAGSMTAVNVQENFEELAKTNRETLINKVSEIKANKSLNVDVEVSVEPNTVAVAVNKIVSEEPITCVLVENRKEESFWVFDSTHVSIAKDVHAPVLIVPQNAEYKEFGKLLYATDYNKADLETIGRIDAFTGQIQPKITAIHITDSKQLEDEIQSKGFEEMLEEKFGKDKVDVDVVPGLDEDLAERMNHFALDNGYDAIVALKANHGFFERIFRSSSTKKIIKEAQLPVLVFHENEK